MHFSATRGIEIAWRPSVHLSVTLVDQNHTSLKSWKPIARIISPTPSLFVAQRPSTYSQANMGKCGGEVQWEKVACWSTKAAISLKRVKIEEKLLWRAYRNSPTLFRTVPPPTPYGLPFPKIGVRNPTQNCNRYYLRNGLQIWAIHSQGPSEQQPITNLGEKGEGARAYPGLPKFFEYPYYLGGLVV